AGVLTGEKELADYYEATVKYSSAPKKAANWVMGEFLKEINASRIALSDVRVSPVSLSGLISLVEKGTISGKIAKEVFSEMFKTGKNPALIIKERDLVQISDETQIEEIIIKALSENSKVVEDYKKGKKSAAGFMVGLVMKATKGKANPKLVNEILRKKLEKL
ncbi:MAG: Asp-tRNA(Asn)/Glu-tRNA(Gln) amidotransferase GatCAB subunit B, partial [Candidatus Aureabacteria bacterium]|nr:Asp-tRNA(Asn)/Glu-tRNA(Gln) amidotransferase GatCAB subunit B [Candidatus Auribacterota bacterium]